MSTLELMVDIIDGRLHAAVVDKGVLSDLYVDAITTPTPWASIYKGKVAKIDKRLDGAIVDLGGGLQGFLPSKHISFPDSDGSEDRTGIADLLKNGDTVMVQIKAEAKRSGVFEQEKLPRLTTKLNLLGQYMIYCPLASRVTMSRNIESHEILGLTAKLKGKGGWIVQTAAEKADESEILAETDRLIEEWNIIVAGKETGDDKPRMLKSGPNAVYRALFDYGAHAFEHIHAGCKQTFDIIAGWAEKYQPALATSKRLRLFKPEKAGQSLFDIYDLHAELDIMKDAHVHLSSGGSLIIEPTHAVVVVDVNQGSAASIVETNLEAAKILARQIMLRNLNGAILADFINMPMKTERIRVLDELERCLQNSHTLSQVHGFSRIGIVEITRKRRTAMYHEKLKS